MKKSKFLSVLLFCLAITFQGSAQKKNYKVVCVGFYNLENLFDTINQPEVNDEEFTPSGSNHYTPTVYLDKLSKLQTVISDIGKDVSPDGLALMGCAEIENITVLQDLIHQPLLKDRNLQIVHYDSPDERGIDVGLLYNPKYFKVKSSDKLFVTIKNDDGTLHYTRDILYVYGLLDGEPVHVFVNHWPSRRGGEEASAPNRAMAASVARAKIDSIQKVNPTAKVILMGDLNDDPVSPSLTNVLKATGDTAMVTNGRLFNPWTHYYNQGIGTLAYNDAWNLFDQIVVSQSFLNKDQKGIFLKDAKIYRREFMIQQSGRYKGYPKRTYDYSKYIGGYSDHFPTYLVLYKEAKEN
ncbi:MAG: hypothetical protein ABI772_11930 [Bacteroidota bacterium]